MDISDVDNQSNNITPKNEDVSQRSNSPVPAQNDASPTKMFKSFK